MRKLYQRWLNRKMADLLEKLLNSGAYADETFMCTAIKRCTPLFGGLFIYTGFVQKRTMRHIHKEIDHYLTLFGYLQSKKLWSGSPGKEFIQQAGIPFYRNMIYKLREDK